MSPHLPPTRLLAASIAQAATSATQLTPRLALRTFTSTPITLGYKPAPLPPHEAHLPVPLPSTSIPEMPPYPHGPKQVYHQSNAGLYGHSRIQTGNHVTHKAFPKFDVKVGRKWRPNVQRKRLWSEALGCMVRARLTTRVLRTVDKAGGLDEYLLGGKSARLRELGVFGWKLRWRLMQTAAVQERFAREREALGLPPREEMVTDEVVGLLAEEGVREEGIKEEVEGMLERDEEFDLGPSEDFMHEEKPRKP